MDNILEQQRAAHEDAERLEQAMVEYSMHDTKTHREKLLKEHVMDRFLNRIADKNQRLLDLYADHEGLRQSEIEALSGTSEFSEFYERLRVIKDHHRKFPNETVEPPEMEFIRMNQEHSEDDYEQLDKQFSGEEGFGRYLDLIGLHNLFVNLKGIKRLDYLQYIDEFDNFVETYPKAVKYTVPYREYLDQLRSYLESFFRRAHPLFDLKTLQQKAQQEIDEKFDKGEMPGWEDVADKESQGIFCEACQKNFPKQTVYDHHLKGKKHIKAQERLQASQNAAQTNGNANGNGKSDKNKTTAYEEALISLYTEALSDFREETKANVERKQALTDKERTLEQEQEEVDLGEQESDEDDEDRIYNPLKLPLGWDGKPIPYWLYKLHGLGVEYPCEICGNYVYMGRKAFDKHFQEWRHAHGMRCLGIPNSRHFHEITKIDDAYTLYEKLKSEGQQEDFRADTMEEYEDDEGNVFNKKTYEDLRRQGII
ncbi:hypothetical protein BCR43DRAFT_459761 [Syncephalastrum racemosum]|uniref:Matrin-type domain-containing protein n=1 Tax=Syncephalastrum racemosum TaxID=13706 RepID=A0A1X2HAY5_SYNRA|nr:hypothetical protein BCR43DRAFT_459761 [Syncephalastrum racemosum]